MNIDIYYLFEQLCYIGNIKDIQNFKQYNNIDINYDDGYFLEILCIHDNIELIDMLINNGADITINNNGIVRKCAHNGYIRVLDHLLKNYKLNIDFLIKTTAYTNCKKSFDIINKYK